MRTSNINLSSNPATSAIKSERLKKGLDFLKNNDFTTMPVGKYEIQGDEIYAFVQEYETISRDACKFEAHLKYIDIQYIVEGDEFIGYLPIDGLEISEEYNPEKDIMFFKQPEVIGGVYLKSGDYAIFEPEDAHAPKGMGASPSKNKKVVVKVMVD